MIKHVISTGKYINVSGGSTSNYINNYGGAQGVGNIRYNTSNQNMEVYDGNNWNMLNMGSVSVGLNHEAESLLDWARQKRDEEYATLKLAETNSTIKSLLDEMNKYKNQIEMVKILMKNEVKV